MKSTHHYSTKEEDIIELFVNLGVSRSYAEKLINLSNLTDKNHRFFNRRPILIHTEEDEGDIESYYLYDTVFYPPIETKSHDTINQ